ncbi:GNAT family N-acetyltransferase [Chryseobacterium rhizosphaerae]|jgi:Acetyltransferases, including N-acetylases of ribosomal proteins|uniref:N-acetyltransferase n=1 Tax=Chryseobacterium rhizosphaerae TaxID=395937 RepID=A0ABX9IQA2_9FLAO|nr:GNAT family N-acetyltransferase [Chryseobacterium rhizosphaerae]MDR6544578.1 RimJ/RimL family protein N-acetyltransferase [Chryseobacterium rhizosphaerae]REC78318.1 N-acetyltransferase [Chryseobacterium rhizosphaerae]GEN66607.1 N-acetyltransferase [Chryseobacterium rhizosphaerae]
MNEFPIIETERLILSQLEEKDIPFITEYLQHRIYSDLTSNIPYPYTENDAQLWLTMSKEAFEDHTGYTFGIRNKEGHIIGAIGLHDRDDDKAELGYWIAMPYWNKGYVTEAAKAIVHFGFKKLNFNKIFATHLLHNPASGKIMEKIGMEKEAVLKQETKKDGAYFDLVMYSIFNDIK